MSGFIHTSWLRRSRTPRDGHGQHQISAIVARDAYNLAADTVRFPVDKFGAPWTPLKFYRLAFFSPQERTLAINIGEYNPYLGVSYQEIAANSRSQHKSQGFGSLIRKGVVWDYLTREIRESPRPPPRRNIDLWGSTRVASDRARWPRKKPAGASVPIEFEAVADREAVAIGDPSDQSRDLQSGRAPF